MDTKRPHGGDDGDVCARVSRLEEGLRETRDDVSALQGIGIRCDLGLQRFADALEVHSKMLATIDRKIDEDRVREASRRARFVAKLDGHEGRIEKLEAEVDEVDDTVKRAAMTSEAALEKIEEADRATRADAKHTVAELTKEDRERSRYWVRWTVGVVVGLAIALLMFFLGRLAKASEKAPLAPTEIGLLLAHRRDAST